MLQQRASEGLMWQQIADGMGEPKIAVKVSERVQAMYFANDGKTSETTVPTTEVATAKAALVATRATAPATPVTGKTTALATEAATPATVETTAIATEAETPTTVETG